MVEIPNKVTLWALEIFVAAVEEGTISQAAKRLGSSPSTVSQHLTNLEAALGTTLLDRTTRPMKLTKTGQLFLRRAQNIIAELMQAKAELVQFNHSKMLRLRLGVIDDFNADVTPGLMTQLSKRMSNAQFLLESGTSYDLIAGLESQSLDVIVTADRDITQDWMEVYPLVTEPYLVAAPKGRIDQKGAIAEQLLGLPFIRYSSREMMGRQIEAHLTRLRIKLPNQFEFDNYHSIHSLVAEGAGWTITTPMGFLRAHRFIDEIDLMPLPFKAMSRSISLIARSDTLGKIPDEMTEIIRPLIQTRLIDEMIAAKPWLKDQFRMLV